ncbi:cytidine deaminase-like protein [Thozetella sp. PMI_491]|nr:cytidine deaminase-like protein [Thozetella sp. PMI_491]
MISDADLGYLRRCVELARGAVQAGNAPFGSVLVDAAGKILKEDQNRVTTEADVTLHPEFTLAVWAQKNMSPADRATATVYTSGEHCPMCSSTHAYAGLGRIVFATSAGQYAQWMSELGGERSPVAMHTVSQIAPGIPVDGPAPELAEEVLELHRLRVAQKKA